MSGMSLGLGLGLTMGSQQGSKIDKDREKLREAIKNTRRIEAKYCSLDVALHPYALYISGVGELFLFAVVVCTEDLSLAGFEPKHLSVNSLAEIKISERDFLPNCAFDLKKLSAAREIIYSVADSIDFG